MDVESASPLADEASAPRARRVRGNFVLVAWLAMVAVVVYGFSFTIDDNLLHPTIPRPPLLYVHAALFTSWLALFGVQAALVRIGRVRWHRRLGQAGIVVGALVPPIGVATAFVMMRFHISALHDTDAAIQIVIPLFDMVCFTATFAGAVWWRRDPARHRRLMYVATCALTAAGWGRFPPNILPSYLFYGGVDALILLAVVRDLIVERRVHRVYLWVLPAFMVGQTLTTLLAFDQVETWTRLARDLFV